MPNLKNTAWLRKINKNEIILFIISFILAWALWIYIAYSVSPFHELTLEDIPVSLDIADTKAEENNLSVISTEIENPKVTVKINGYRKDIGGITKDDITARVDFDAMQTNNTGKQKLPIKIETKYNIQSMEIEPSTLEVTLDYYANESFNVSAEIDHKKLKAQSSGDIIDEANLICVPSKVVISGPTVSLNQIDHIRVILDEEDVIDETKIYSNITHYELVDKNGTVISDTNLNVQNPRFSVTVPVYYMKKLPITLNITGVPNGFDTEWLMKRLRIVDDKQYPLAGYGDEGAEYKAIQLKTSNKKLIQELEKRDSYNINDVPISKLSLSGNGVPVEVRIDDGFKDASNLGSVTITLDTTDLTTKMRSIENTAISVVNGAADYEYTKAPGRTMVTLIGLTEEVTKIRASDLQASVSLTNADSDATNLSSVVSITLPEGIQHVWISPLPMLSITCEKKQTETTQTTTTTTAAQTSQTTATTAAMLSPSLVL